MITRRGFIAGAVASTVGALGGCKTSHSSARVVVVGGGFGGATAARTLKQLNPSLDVTLIEPKRQYVACPFSNLVIAGERNLSQQTFSYDALSVRGVNYLGLRAAGIDPVGRWVNLEGGQRVPFDRLILAPGIGLDYEKLPGYSEQVSMTMPHAWQAGEQTNLLRAQLNDMPDGGLVVMSIPENPYRCPPGPYERASLIANYLKKHKPRSKVLLLDSKDRFSKQGLFQAAWKDKLSGYIEWQGRSDGAAVVRVDGRSKTLETDFESVRADVANVIPPQKAGAIAINSGIADESGWCPVDALTFESTIAPGIHVIGDAAILNAMPKSAFSANAQGKLCAVQVIRSLKGLAPLEATLANTCYSLIQPDLGISVAGVYRADGERWRSVKGAGGTSPVDASADHRRLEAKYAEDWFRRITTEAFL